MKGLIISMILVAAISTNAAIFTDTFESYTAGTDIITAGSGRYGTFGGTDLGYVRQSSDAEDATKILEHKQINSTNQTSLTTLVAANIDQQVVGKVLCQLDIKPVSGSTQVYFSEDDTTLQKIDKGVRIIFYPWLGIQILSTDPNRALATTLLAANGKDIAFYEPGSWYRISAVLRESKNLGERGALVDVVITDLTNGGVLTAISNFPSNGNPALIRSARIMSWGEPIGEPITGYTPYEGRFDNWKIQTTASDCIDIQLYGMSLASDLNADCNVNFKDFAVFADTWLDTCNNPEDKSCVDTW